MSDRRLTFFELHTHGNVQIGPASVPGLGSDGDEAAERPAEPEADSEGAGAGTVARVLVALGLLVAIAAIVRKVRNGEPSDVPLAESDEIPTGAD